MKDLDRKQALVENLRAFHTEAAEIIAELKT